MSSDTYITINLSQYSIRVFRNALKALGPPSYVRFFLNPERNMMIMQPFERKSPISFKVPPKIMEKDKSSSLRVYSHPLCTILMEKMKWEAGGTYKIPGEIFNSQRLVRFDLNKAFKAERIILK